jgi:hypothetical protein
MSIAENQTTEDLKALLDVADPSTAYRTRKILNAG